MSDAFIKVYNERFDCFHHFPDIESEEERPIAWCEECQASLHKLYAGAYRLCDRCGDKRESETSDRISAKEKEIER